MRLLFLAELFLIAAPADPPRFEVTNKVPAFQVTNKCKHDSGEVVQGSGPGAVVPPSASYAEFYAKVAKGYPGKLFVGVAPSVEYSLVCRVPSGWNGFADGTYWCELVNGTMTMRLEVAAARPFRAKYIGYRKSHLCPVCGYDQREISGYLSNGQHLHTHCDVAWSH